jgi:hypothetical protein
MKAYGALAMPAVRGFGGRFLTGSGSRVQAHEAAVQLRSVGLEFEN